MNMRATSPLDCIQYMGSQVALPTPKYATGTKVNVSAMDSESREYYEKNILKEILKSTQKIIYKMKKEGYMKGMQGKKMLPHNKNQIRQKLDVMRNAHTVELAGCAPSGMHAVGTVGNECYLQNGQCHSGVSYKYYLLFRCEFDGNEVVFIHDEPVIGEPYIKELLVKEVSEAA